MIAVYSFAITLLFGVAYLWATGIDNNIDNTNDEL